MSNLTDNSNMPLAIVGMACRLPGADNLDEYWKLVIEGRSAIAELPAERLDQELYFDPRQGVRGKSYSKLGAVISSRRFDRQACPISERLEKSVDIVHLLMCEVAAAACRHAGWDPFNLPLRNVGVFVGHAQGSNLGGEYTYATCVEEAAQFLYEVDDFQKLPPDQQKVVIDQLVAEIRGKLPRRSPDSPDVAASMVAGTISKALGLTGPFLAINSACASSLQAMLVAARALQAGRIDMAIVGGASDCKGDSLVLFSHAQSVSATGSRPFDADADGLICSEGYVAVVMKTLARALADGDRICAIVRGLGVASDGRGKSLWAPRKEGQVKAMERAYARGVEIGDLQYLEAHATATQLGDATELTAVSEFLRGRLPAGRKIPITSVKANIGHALEAAGLAGVIKAVLCMQHGMFPPAINVRKLNQKIDWDKMPVYVPLSPALWPSPPEGRPRRAGVNAFGIGGLNMHVVLDEWTESSRQLVVPAASSPKAAAAGDPDAQSVAVIGMGCIFAGASNLPGFWDLLVSGRDAKSPAPPDRWRADLAHRPGPPQPYRSPVTRGGYITGFQYDWRAHKIPPKQIEQADPLQFMLMESADEALRDSGYDKKPFDRTRAGVVVGTEFGGDFSFQLQMALRLPDMGKTLRGIFSRHGVSADCAGRIEAKFAEALLRHWPALIDESGSFSTSALASRINKTWDLMGGAAAIDCGDNSALAALSLASDLLLAGDCDLMVCAAGQRRMGLPTYETLAQVGSLALREDAAAPFDAQACGYLPGEGVGVLILKRLADARRDGDPIRAIVRGVGAAHAPQGGEALQTAIQQSLAGGVRTDDIAVLESDGAASPPEDSEAIRAIAAAYGADARRQPLRLSSVVGQIGHTAGASGMASLLKAALEIDHGQSTGTVNLYEPLPVMAEVGIAAATGLAPLGTTPDGRRLAGVSSCSRSLAHHAILERGVKVPVVEKTDEKPQPAARAAGFQRLSAAAAPDTWRICRLGASTPDELRARLARADAASLWAESVTGRFQSSQQARLAIVAGNIDALRQKLSLAARQLLHEEAAPVLQQQGIFYWRRSAVRPRIAFLFAGQGSQYPGMLRQLVEEVPAAADAMRRFDAVMLREGYPTFAQIAWEEPGQLGRDVFLTQASVLLADAIVLAALADRGIRPDVVAGHSYGEYVAVMAAGGWEFDEALRATRARCDAIQSSPSARGTMLAVQASLAQVESLVARVRQKVYVANHNAPDQVVVGGSQEGLAELAAVAKQASCPTRLLPVPCPFHTPLLRDAGGRLEVALRGIEIRRPCLPMFSVVTNRRVVEPDAIRANLVAHMTHPVHYVDLIQNLVAEADTVLVEVGPQQALTRLHQRILASQPIAMVASDQPKRAGVQSLLCVEAVLDCAGALEETPAAAPPATVAAPQHSEAILAFDATARRREKMRRGSAVRPIPSLPPLAAAPVAISPRAGNDGRADGNGKQLDDRESKANGNGRKLGGNGRKPVVSQPAGVLPRTNRFTVQPSPTPAQATSARVPAQPSPPVSPPADGAELEKFLINFVVEQTGYPTELVELDADLEADLGIDSIKKAQLFGELREYFDVTPSEDLSLDDFPTLRHVLKFLQGAPVKDDASLKEPAAAVVAEPLPVARPQQAPLTVATAAETPELPPAGAELEKFLINFVVEQTGYPTEVVELDADLEADLGIDSIKKAQLFGELREYFDVTPSEDLSLDDFPTLQHVLKFLQGAPVKDDASLKEPAAAVVAEPLPITRSQEAPVAAATAAETPVSSASPAGAELEKFLINFVVEQTGYPTEVVELDADLEADLGIDSIKKAQLFGELREYFDVTPSEDLSLDDFPTLRHVLKFLQGAPVKDDASLKEPAAAVVAEPLPITRSQEAPVAAATAAETPVSSASPAGAELEKFLINFVVEQTGYPTEVVELDADLEADLGIDSIKKAQLFGELREYFDVMPSEDLSLDDFPTLRHVLKFLQGAPVKGEVSVQDASLSAANAETPSPATIAQPDVFQPVQQSNTPYGLGFARGSHEKTVILRLLHRYADLPAHALAELPPPDGGPEGWLAALDTDSLDELQGIADAVEVSLANMAAVNFALASIMQTARMPRTAEAGDVLARARECLDALAAGSRLVAGLRDCLLPVVRADNGARTGAEISLVGAIDGPAAAKELLLTPATGEPADILPPPIADHAGLQAQPTSADINEVEQDAFSQRFVMRMVDAPFQSGAPAAVEWAGAALVIGKNAAADALRRRLRMLGVRVYDLAISEDLDATLAAFDALWRQEPLPHLFLMSERDPRQDLFDEAVWRRHRHHRLIGPYFLCQRWIERASESGLLNRCSIVAATSLGGDFGFSGRVLSPHGGAFTGLIKALCIEFRVLRELKGMITKAIDTPDDEPVDLLAENIVRELAAKTVDYEVAFVGGVRRLQNAVAETVRLAPDAKIRRGGAWVISGGARGITAACALELGRRFGLKLHLLGASPLSPIDPAWRDLSDEALKQLKSSIMTHGRREGETPDRAWDRVQACIERDRALRAFAEAGVAAVYHSCDVGDRAALAAVLDSIRKTDGPIEGVVHGAGIDRSTRFERKGRENVEATIAAKVDGAYHLIALTRQDPVRHFIGFGSISGRLGSNGQTDYCLASDMLCKLMAWQQTLRPDCRATGFHWHPWDEIGMAARPNNRATFQLTQGPQLMPKQEGVRHLLRELYAETPRSEVLITDWEYHSRFYGGQERSPDGKESAEAPATPVALVKPADVDRVAQRHVVVLCDAPLAAGQPSGPPIGGTVLILGSNRAVTALARQLEAAGDVVRLLPSDDDPSRLIAHLDGLWQSGPVRRLFLLTGHDDDAANWQDAAGWRRRRARGVIGPLLLVQRWLQLLDGLPQGQSAALTAVTALGGDFGLSHETPSPEGGVLCGLLKSLHVEGARASRQGLHLKVIDAPADAAPDLLGETICRELAAGDAEIEVAWSQAMRRVVRTMPQPAEALPQSDLPRGGVWVVTGGARGITAACALALGRRYGWKLHLVGKSPAPRDDAPWREYSEAEMKAFKASIVRTALAEGRSPDEDWKRVKKDVEIHKTLGDFRRAGIHFAYHSCDISDWDALAKTLDEIRAADGPIEGVIHGAGYAKPARFQQTDRKELDFTVAAKVDGAVALMALTQPDPLRWFVGFGSLSGRFGGNGLGDYAAANDMLAKLIDAFACRRPQCAAACIHWQTWDEVGMATFADGVSISKNVLQMAFIPPGEGVEHLHQELRAGLPNREVVITDGHFQRTFYPDQEPLATTDARPRPAESLTLPLVESVAQRDDGSLAARLRFDPTADPFLLQHRLREKPFLPAVIGWEAIVEAASLVGGAPAVVALRDVEIVNGMVFHGAEPIEAEVSVAATAEGLACALTSRQFDRKGRLIDARRPHMRAIGELAGAPLPIEAQPPGEPPLGWLASCYSENAPMYHGEPLRCLKQWAVQYDGGWGQIVAPSLAELAGRRPASGWILPPAMLDACLYACGSFLFLQFGGLVAVPQSLQRLAWTRQPKPGENCILRFFFRGCDRRHNRFDFALFGEDQRPLLQAQGFCMVQLAPGG